MQQLLTSFLDLLFPPSPDEKIVRSADTKTIQGLYRPAVHEDVIYLSLYQEPIIAAAIKQNKFHGSSQAATILGTLLATWLQSTRKDALLLPIPLGATRQRERGYNQVERIITASKTTNSSKHNVLIRQTDTPPQSTLARTERLKNVQNAFTVTSNIHTLRNYSHIIIIDDVFTTGATLQAARAALVPHLPPSTTVHCIAIAH